MNLRKSGAATLILVAVSVSAFGGGRSETGRPPLVGTDLDAFQPAPAFALADQTGSVFRMSDTAGKVAVVTFLYTHCTDICPLLALKMKAAHDLLGSDSANVVFVAVTTDPARDTLDVISRYSREAGLYDVWHFVTGTEDSLKPVWAGFGVGVAADPEGIQDGQDEVPASESAEDHDHADTSGHAGESAERDLTKGLGEAEIQLAGTLMRDFGGGYEVAHSAPFIIVDRKGMLRVLLNGDAAPSDIVKDVRVLLGS